MNLSEAKKILELGENYTPEEIKANYRRLIKIYHPDKSGSDSCEFIKIQEAYTFIQKEKPCENIVENILRSFNFEKFFNINFNSVIEITALEYLTGTTKEIKVKTNCRCQKPICKKCLGTGTTIQLTACDICFGECYTKICKCENYTFKKVVIPPKPRNLKIENYKIELKEYKLIGNKLTKMFDITLKESLLGFTKTFEDPFGENHKIISNTIVKQNDGYTIKSRNHEIVLLFNVIYPEKLNKTVKKVLSTLDF
jgi:hypothetical protein